METSQVMLNQGLTFLAIASGIIILIVGGFLTKLLFDISKFTNNLNNTTTIVKKELEPTLAELRETLHCVNAIMENTDKGVSSVRKTLESILGISFTTISKAKTLTGSLTKGFFKGLNTAIKLFSKK